MDFVTDRKAIEYLKSFPKRKKADFYDIFPGCNSDAIDFLLKALRFNPRHRITIDGAIEHLFLTKVRDKSKETTAKGITFILKNKKNIY